MTYAEFTLNTFLLLSAAPYGRPGAERCDDILARPIRGQLVLEKKSPDAEHNTTQHNKERTLHEFCIETQRLASAVLYKWWNEFAFQHIHASSSV